MRASLLAVALLLAQSLAAQGPVFDPDDFVDPRQREGSVFILRGVVGVALNSIDHSRPMDQNVGFIHLANSVYWSKYQFDYKYTKMFGADENAPGRVHLCDCPANEPVYFPTPPLSTATPAPPLPGRRDTFQFAWYRSGGPTNVGIPAMLRYRVMFSEQRIATDVVAVATGRTTQMHGRERSFGFDADTHIRVRGRDVYGSLLYVQTVRTNTPDNRSQVSLGYLARFPAAAWRDGLVRMTLTVRSVSSRDAPVINVVSPAVEALWRHPASRVNFHVVWTPEWIRSGADGWQPTNQVAVFAERALYVKPF